ncbi:hypothetical protein AB1E18_001084 [Capra hircus]
MGTFAYSTPLTPRPAARNGDGGGGNFELTPGDRRTCPPAPPRAAGEGPKGSTGSDWARPSYEGAILFRSVCRQGTQMKVKLKKMSLSPKEKEDGEDEMSEDKESGSRDEFRRPDSKDQFFIFVYGCCPSEE